MADWIEYWNSDNPIYVNARHKMLHYRGIANDICDLIDTGGVTALDYGCGEALSADIVAKRCSRLILADAAPNVREKLSTRFAGNPAISVASPDEIEAMPDGSLDMIVIHSVAQYLEKADFARLTESLSDKLRAGGQIIIGDILPPGLSPLTDAKALLEFGLVGGFLLPAIFGLVRTALSDYRKIRGELGLTHYDEAELLALLEGFGLTATRLKKNPGHNQARIAFAGRKG